MKIETIVISSSPAAKRQLKKWRVNRKYHRDGSWSEVLIKDREWNRLRAIWINFKRLAIRIKRWVRKSRHLIVLALLVSVQ
jgi:hypothetical protein